MEEDKNKYTWLLWSLILLLAFMPFRLLQWRLVEFFFAFLNSIVILTSLISARDRQKLFILTAFFALPTFLTFWLGYSSVFKSEVSMLVSSTLFYGLFIYVIGSEILVKKKKVIDREVLAGSLSIYLLSGLAFACLYTLLQINDPNAFLLPDVVEVCGIEIKEGDPQSKYLMPTFIYHSFVTLSTLGYGDIQPQSFPARFMCIAQAIIGQLYMVVVVAGIVGVTANNYFKSEKDN